MSCCQHSGHRGRRPSGHSRSNPGRRHSRHSRRSASARPPVSSRSGAVEIQRFVSVAVGGGVTPVAAFSPLQPARSSAQACERIVCAARSSCRRSAAGLSKNPSSCSPRPSHGIRPCGTSNTCARSVLGLGVLSAWAVRQGSMPRTADMNLLKPAKTHEREFRRAVMSAVGLHSARWCSTPSAPASCSRKASPHIAWIERAASWRG